MTFETVVVAIFTGIIGGETVHFFNDKQNEFGFMNLGLVIVSAIIVFIIVEKHNKKELKND